MGAIAYIMYCTIRQRSRSLRLVYGTSLFHNRYKERPLRRTRWKKNRHWSSLIF